MRILRTDNGGEYTSTDFELYLTENGIAYEVSPPHTPEGNSVIEQFNRTIMTMGRPC